MIKIKNTKHAMNVYIKELGIVLFALLILVSIAGASPFAYVTNHGSNNISVIDTSKNTVIGTIDLGDLVPREVALSPDGKTLYVSVMYTPTLGGLYSFDTATNLYKGWVLIGRDPRGVAVSYDGKMVYVTNHDSDNVSVIDTQSNKKFDVNVGSDPTSICINKSSSSQFKMIFKDGYDDTGDILDTFNGTYTRDMISCTDVTVDLTLTPEELNTIYQKMNDINFFNYPDNFFVATNTLESPHPSYYFKVEYDGKIKELSWEDYGGFPSQKPDQDKVNNLHGLIRLIEGIIKSKDAYKNLPKPCGGIL
jgi:YVTN family beta-propeller protein